MAMGYCALPGTCRWSGLVKKSATRQDNAQWEALKSHDLLHSHVPRVSILVRLMCYCVLLYQAGRPDVVCHLVGRG